MEGDGGTESPTGIRITRHGKIRLWVKKALEFFQVRSIRPRLVTL